MPSKKKKNQQEFDSIINFIEPLFKSHPWHGIPIGKNAPSEVTTFIELVPTDTIKYELDKISGYLRVDRPQQYSNVCPTSYGLIPQTYCADRVAKLCAEATGMNIKGDGDPLDICVLAEKPPHQGNILLQAIPIGGFRLIDGNEADDKIISVMKGDPVYGRLKDIHELSSVLLARLRHYFLTYKDSPDTKKRECEITHTYGHEEAFQVIRASQEDYKENFQVVFSAMERYKQYLGQVS